MNVEDLFFTAGPPLLAIALQRWGSPSDEALGIEAEQLRKEMHLREPQKTLIRGSLTGAVGIASLAATYLAIFGATAGLLYTAHAHRLVAYTLLVLGIGVVMFVSNKLQRMTYFDIVEQPIEASSTSGEPFRKHFRHRIDIINAVIYGLNGFLILLALVAYFNLLPNWASGERTETKQEQSTSTKPHSAGKE